MGDLLLRLRLSQARHRAPRTYGNVAIHGASASARIGVEQRRLGSTDIVGSVLGFGGSEIGYQDASARTVARLLGEALDAGLNVIDTAECYDDSESLIGKALGARRPPPRGRAVHEVRARRRLVERRLAARAALGQHRAQPAPTRDRSRRSHSAPQLLARRAEEGRSDRGAGARAGAWLHPLYRLQRRRRGG